MRLMFNNVFPKILPFMR